MLKRIKDKIRNYFIAGLLTVVPLSITLYVISVVLRHSDRIFDLIPSRYNPKAYTPFPLTHKDNQELPQLTSFSVKVAARAHVVDLRCVIPPLRGAGGGVVA